jgi:phosphoribosylformylglycinamidine cyclo-ligase
MYEPGKTDLAGFAVGIVDREKVIHGKAVRAGDIVLGLASNGLHSNGFSLIRKLIVRENWDMNSKIDGDDRPLIDIILAPTRLYVKQIHALIDKVGINADGGVRALAHITGGGLIDNVPRSFPENFAWKVNLDGWTSPPIFKMIKKSARLPRCGLWETFNCGIGYTVIVGAEFADEAEKSLKDSGEKVYRLGEIIPASDEYGDNVVIDSKGLWD